jgi:hypothetical protein
MATAVALRGAPSTNAISPNMVLPSSVSSRRTRLNSHPSFLNDIEFRRWVARVEDYLAGFECARGDLRSDQDTEVDVTVQHLCGNYLYRRD